MELLRRLGTPCIIHQPKYSMFERWIEGELLALLEREGIGCIAFSPLAQGLLTDKYLSGIPAGSRASKPHSFLKAAHLTDDKLAKVRRLNEVAQRRSQKLSQMALAWVLRQPAMTSTVIGASRVSQIDDAVAGLGQLDFSADDLQSIDAILNS